MVKPTVETMFLVVKPPYLSLSRICKGVLYHIRDHSTKCFHRTFSSVHNLRLDNSADPDSKINHSVHLDPSWNKNMLKSYQSICKHLKTKAICLLYEAGSDWKGTRLQAFWIPLFKITMCAKTPISPLKSVITVSFVWAPWHTFMRSFETKQFGPGLFRISLKSQDYKVVPDWWNL